MYNQSYPGQKMMTRCRPGRRCQPGHVTVPPLGEWKALRRGQMNHRCPNHEVGPQEGRDGLLLSEQVWSTPRPGGWREQKRKRRKTLQVTVQIFQKWTWGSRKAYMWPKKYENWKFALTLTVLQNKNCMVALKLDLPWRSQHGQRAVW